MDQSMHSAVPEPRSGVMPTRRQVPAPSTRGGPEPAPRYTAGLAPNGGLFALLHGRGVLKMVRNGLPFSMFDELVGAVGGSHRELAAIIGIPATTLARRKRSGMLRHRVVHVRLMLDHHVQRLHAAVTARRSIDQAMQCMR